MDTSTPLGHLIGRICRPTLWRDKRVRALRPWSEGDMQLFLILAQLQTAAN